MQENFNLEEYIKSEKFLETAVVLLFVSVFIFLKLAQPWGYQISHPFPAFYNANDNFVNGYVYPQYIKEVGNFRYDAPYLNSGYQNIVGYYPVLLTHLSAMLSLTSGVQTYDTSYLVVTLFSISAILLIYFVIRRHSKELALLSLPFMLGVFNFDFEIARAFGLWIFLTGVLFLAAVIWISDKLDRKNMFVLLALFLSGAALGHTSETIFASGFLAFYFVLKRTKDGAFDKPWAKHAIFGFGLFVILSVYYLIIFKNSWMIGLPYKFEVMDAPPFAPNFGVKLSDFGVTLLPVIAGILIGLKLLAFRKKEEFPFTAVAAGLFILIIGYTNYIGFSIRAWQTRISWPIYFAVFGGIAIYYACRKFIKNWNFRYAVAISLTLLILFSFMHINKLRGGGIVDQGGWDTLMWIKSNTPADSKIMYFYGVLPSQPFSLWSPGRVPYTVDLNDYIDGAQRGIIKSNYSVAPFDAAGFMMHLPYQKSPLTYGHYVDESAPIKGHSDTFEDMDYYVLPIGSSSTGNPNVAQYNLVIRDTLLKNPQIREVYSNEEYAVLKKNRG